ncbi:hypothetical protein J6590_048225 [Homalodisca vitripennis]|nr:hypothetical protein J6590_048225 [Homalodisca vitripennis]
MNPGIVSVVFSDVIPIFIHVEQGGEASRRQVSTGKKQQHLVVAPAVSHVPSTSVSLLWKCYRDCKCVSNALGGLSV